MKLGEGGGKQGLLGVMAFILPAFLGKAEHLSARGKRGVDSLVCFALRGFCFTF